MKRCRVYGALCQRAVIVLPRRISKIEGGIAEWQHQQEQSQAFREVVRWCPGIQSSQPLSETQMRFAPLQHMFLVYNSWLAVGTPLSG